MVRLKGNILLKGETIGASKEPFPVRGPVGAPQMKTDQGPAASKTAPACME